MFVNSDELPQESRIWVFQSNRPFTDNEEKEIALRAENFLSGWTAHSKELKAGYEIRDHIFLILMLDEGHASASGCSIDKSMHFIQNIEKDFNLRLLDRNVFAYKNEQKISLLPRGEFQKLFSEGTISPDTIVFDNHVTRKDDLTNRWQVPLRESWIFSLVN